MGKKIPKEILDKVMLINCDKEDGIRRLKKSLMKLPVIKDESYLSITKLEMIVKKIERKHNLLLSYVTRYYYEDKDEFLYSGMIKDGKHKWLITISAVTIWEMFAKVVFFMYYHVESLKGD